MLFGRDKRSRTEQELRDARPRAPHQLLDQLTAEAGPARRRRNGYRSAGARLAVLGIAVVALAAVGGIGFAASTAFNTTKVKVQTVAAGEVKSVAITQAGAVRNAASDQYGDGTRRVLPGPPQLTPDKKIVVPATNLVTGSIDLSTAVTVSESGVMAVSVERANGDLLTLNCSRTKFDGKAPASCPGTIARFQVEMPRKLPITVSVAGGQLKANEKLSIRVDFTDRDNPNNSRKSSQAFTTVDVKAPASVPRVLTTTVSKAIQKDVDRRLARGDDDVDVVLVITGSPQSSVFTTWGRLSSLQRTIVLRVSSKTVIPTTAKTVVADGSASVAAQFKVVSGR